MTRVTPSLVRTVVSAIGAIGAIDEVITPTFGRGVSWVFRNRCPHGCLTT